jgi:hypothetical protein
VTESWAERRLAVSVEKLSNHGHEGEHDSDKAVLVDSNIYHLRSLC